MDSASPGFEQLKSTMKASWMAGDFGQIANWLGTTPALGVCTLCSREFKVPMSALKRTGDAQASLQGQFDRHECEPQDTRQAAARVPDAVLLRQAPDEDDDEEEDEDDRKNEDEDDGDTDDGYSE